MNDKVLLVGNGINRLSNEYSWSDLLDELIKETGTSEVMTYREEKPFTLLYEEIYLLSLKHLRSKELRLKQKIANLVLNKFTPNEFHTKILDLDVEAILTTNYDYNLERSFEGNHGKSANVLTERKYNLFRRRNVNGRHIWHTHGEADAPNSITLGHEHYVGYLQKMGNYLKDKITSKRKGVYNEIRSPIQKAIHKREEIRAFDKDNTIYSWVDLFLMNDVYILGLALDYTEIDLWWLMIFKERLKRETGFQYGDTVYYKFYPHILDKKEEAKLSIIESFGVNVIKKDVGTNYENAGDAYNELINEFPKGG
jgi:hypothetical protein